MQYYRDFFTSKNENFIGKKSNFQYFRSKHTLWVHVMFWIKLSNLGIPLQIPVFSIIKVGFKEVYISWTCFPDNAKAIDYNTRSYCVCYCHDIYNHIIFIHQFKLMSQIPSNSTIKLGDASIVFSSKLFASLEVSKLSFSYRLSFS